MGMFMHKHLNFFSRILVLFCVLSIFAVDIQPLFAQGNGIVPVAGSQGTFTPNSNNPGVTTGSPLTEAVLPPLGVTTAGNNPIKSPVLDVNSNPNLAPVQEPAAVTTPIDDTDSKIYNAAVWLGGWIVAAGGALFDLSIEKVVLKMGCWFVENPAGECDTVGASGAVGGVVNELWSVVRDLFNILFIFALVWIGLRMILFADDSGTQRTLGMLIAAALLINFSLYFTKAIVDVANFTAITIHQVAIGGMKGDFGFDVGEINSDGNFSGIDNDGSGGTSDVGYKSDASIASAYMQALKISSWFSGSPLTSTGEILVYSVILLLFSIILGITLAFGGIMLISRFIALIILMIFSPAMFLGWVLPGFKKYSSEWWNKFLGYAFFAPAYIFMLYLGLYTLIQLGNMVGQDATYADAMGGEWKAEMFTIFLFYALGIGFLFAATKVGQSMSIAGSSAAMATTQGAMRRMRNGGARFAGWGTAGLLAKGGRGTLGWTGDKLAKNQTLSDHASGRRGNLLTRTSARAIRSGAAGVGKSSFDARRVAGVGKSLGIGEGVAGGYTGDTERRSKEEVTFAKTLGHNPADEKKRRSIYLNDEKTGLLDEAKKEAHAASEATDLDKREGKIKQYKEDLKVLNTRLNAATDDNTRTDLSTQINAKNVLIEERKVELGLRSAENKVKELTATMEGEIGDIENARVKSYIKLKNNTRIGFGGGGLEWGRQQKAHASKIEKELLKKSSKDKVVDLLKDLDDGAGEKKAA